MRRIRLMVSLACLATTLTLVACQVPSRLGQSPQARSSVDGASAPPTARPMGPAALPPGSSAPAPLSGEMPSAGEEPGVIVAAAADLDASGLLAELLPAYEQASGVKILVRAVDSAQALDMGRRGEADALWVHAPNLEAAFMGEGHGTRKEPVMYNDYLLVGNPEDPAQVKGLTQAVEAFSRLSSSGALYIAPADGTGVGILGRELIARAGVEPGDWYMSSERDAATALNTANEGLAYTLTDRALYEIRRTEGLDLEVMVSGDPTLRNPYSAIVVKARPGAPERAEMANAFVDWLISLPIQTQIGGFGVARYGRPAYLPDSRVWRGRAG